MRRGSWGSVKPPVGSQLDWSDPINCALVSCWPTNEKGGTRVVDIARRNDAVITASTLTWETEQKVGISVEYASSAYAVTQLTPAGITDFSISLWATNNIAGQTGFPLSARNAAASNGIFVLYQGGHGIEVGFSNAGALTRQKSGVDWAAGVPHHVVGTHAAGATSMLLYVDGVLIGTAIESAASNPGDGGKMAFARDGDASTPNYWTGNVSNVRFYRRVLFAMEAKRLYNEPYAGIYKPRRIFVSPAVPLSIPVAMHHYQMQRNAA